MKFTDTQKKHDAILKMILILRECGLNEMDIMGFKDYPEQKCQNQPKNEASDRTPQFF